MNNVGTGTLFGDNISIGATTLNNLAENVAGTVRGATIGARTSLNFGVTTLNNSDMGLDTPANPSQNITATPSVNILSLGDIAIGGSLDAAGQAQGRAASINNTSATIAAAGNVSLSATAIRNTDGHFAYVIQPPTTTAISETIGSSGSGYYANITQQTDSGPIVTAALPATISGGGNVTIDATTVDNANSRILAGGTLSIPASVTIANTGITATKSTTKTGTSYTLLEDRSCQVLVGKGGGCLVWGPWYSYWQPSPYSSTTAQSVTVGANVQASNASTSAPGVQSATLPNSSLFQVNANPTASYFVVTNPAFTNYRTWVGSDYFLRSVTLDPSVTQKRLGDGFYEQRLINEQVAQLTGLRFLGNYTSDDQQFRALMDAGVTFAQSFNLRPGIALTDAQIAQLTSDMVWLQQTSVTLPDGTKTVALVPQVYLLPRAGDLAPSGALMGGATVNINTSGDATNSGTILGRQLVQINANTIQNLGGNLRGNAVVLNAAQDINNTGGQVVAKDSLSATAGRDINNNSTVISTSTNTTVDRLAGLYVTGDHGTLLASAGRDLNLLASVISNGGSGAGTSTANTQLIAARDVTLGTVTTSQTNNIDFSADTFRRSKTTAEAGSTIAAAGNLQVQAGNNLSARAAQINATGDVALSATGDVSIVAGQATSTTDFKQTVKDSGALAKSSMQQSRQTSSSEAIASNVSGNKVTITSGNNIGIKGSNVSATQDTTLVAGNDVLIESAQNTSASASSRSETSSGLSISNMGAVSIGNSRQSQDGTLEGTMQVASTVSGANVRIQAGRDATVKASNVLADQDVTVAAQRDINILAAANMQSSTNRSESSSTSMGLTPSVGGRMTIFGQNSSSQDGTQTQVSSSTSVLSANKGNLTLAAANTAGVPKAKGKLTTQGAELLAGNKVILAGAEVDLQAITDATSSLSRSESKSFTVGAAPAGLVGSAVVAISDNVALSQSTQNTRLKDAAALKASYDAYKFANGGAKQGAAKTATAIKNAPDAAAKAAAQKGDPSQASFGVSVSIGSSSSSSESASSTTVSRGTNIQAKDITITATQGDITATAAKLQAENITIDAAKNVNLIAAANTETSTSSNNSNSAGVGVTFGVGQNSGISFQLRAAQAQGRANGSETTFDNTTVTASKNLTVRSGTDTNLIGAQLAGETVKMEVGTSGSGKLNIETLQDKSTFTSSQSSSGFDASVCLPPLCYGTSTVSVSLAQQKIDHNYISAQGQSGIAAGKGGYDIKVAGNTDLKGAAITSSADASKNTLATQSLTSSDLANAQNTSSSSTSITVGNNMMANVVGNVLGNALGKDGLPENGSQSGKTLSVISAGNITITGTGNAAKDAQSSQQVATLTSRDASTANQSLKNTLTLQQAQGLEAKQKVAAENAQAGQLVGSVTYNIAGDIAAAQHAKLQKAEDARAKAANEPAKEITTWGESSKEKIALHAIAGYIQASAAGQNGATGALAGAANEALTKVVNEAIKNALPVPTNATPEQAKDNAQSRKALAEAAAQLLGASAVALGGGNAQDVRLGANVALTADRFNRQLHPSEAKLIKENAARYAKKMGVSVERAEAELTQQTLRNNDSAHAERLGAYDPQAQAFLIELGAGKTMVDTMTGQTFQLFAADEATRKNHAMFGQYTKTNDSSPFDTAALLDRAYNKAFKPQSVKRTIEGLDGTNAGAVTGSDLALRDAAMDRPNMRKQPPAVQFAVLGELREERLGNMQAQQGLLQELQQMNRRGEVGPQAANRRGEILDRLGQLEFENKSLRQASVEQIRAMGDAGLIRPAFQREWGEGAGEAIASSGLALKGLSNAQITNKLKMLGGALDEVKSASAATKAEAQALAKTKIAQNASRDDNMTTGLVPAKRVNKAFTDMGYSPPFTEGSMVKVEMSRPGTPANMVVSAGQAEAIAAGKPAFGAFATTDPIPSQQFARESLAITPDMKPDVSMVQPVVTGNRSVVTLEGKIAPQNPAAQYPGGGNQIFYDYPADVPRSVVLKPAGEAQQLPLTTGANGGVVNLAETQATLAAQVADFRATLTGSAKTGGNMGVARIDIPGIQPTMAASSQVDLPSAAQAASGFVGKVPETFPSSVVPTGGAKPFPLLRDVDSEAKILNNVAAKLGDNTSATGTINLLTERSPCASCSNVIDLFKAKYPNITINVFDNNGKLIPPTKKGP